MSLSSPFPLARWAGVAALGLLGVGRPLVAGRTLLNASYDATRELFQSYDPAFTADWRRRTGEDVTIGRSHGPSGTQARAVLDGLPADVVTLALEPDVKALVRGGLVDPDWASRLPRGGGPFFSTIVFLVRRGNPKGIHDWPDLVKDGVAVIPANPKTSGAARWTYLAAWGQALLRPGGGPEAAAAYVRALYAHAPVLDAGSRGATTTFLERGLGDVLVGWEDECLLAQRLSGGAVEVVVPPLSIRAQPLVAVVDAHARAQGTADLAAAYLAGLYTPWAQDLAAKAGFRPGDPAAFARAAGRFPSLRLFTVEDAAGGWDAAVARHFRDGGVFDAIAQGLGR